MYLLIKLLKPSNHWLIDWSDIIVKPHFSLFPLLEHLPLWFKSMHSCTIQFKLYCLKADVIHLYCFDKRTIHNLFFPILCSRQVLSFIAGSIKTVGFPFFFHFINNFTLQVLLQLYQQHCSFHFFLFELYIFHPWQAIMGGYQSCDAILKS